MRSIESQNAIKSIDRLRIFQKVQIFPNLCDPNQKLISIDKIGHRPPLFVRLELIIDELNQISIYMRLVFRFNHALLEVFNFPRASLVNFNVL